MEDLQTNYRLTALVEFLTSIRNNTGVAYISPAMLADLSELSLSEWAAAGIDKPLAGYFAGDFLDALGVMAGDVSDGRVHEVQVDYNTTEAIAIWA